MITSLIFYSYHNFKTLCFPLKEGNHNTSHVHDLDSDGDVDKDDGNNDDIYIMMKCVFVCLSQKMITSHFRAEREVSSVLGLADRRPALA